MRKLLAVVAFVGVVTVLSSSAAAAPILIGGTGATAGDLTIARDAFRAAIGGGTVPGANGSFGGIRREINWDGVPDAFAAPNPLPADFFNVNSPRGAVFSTPGTGFQVSANAASGTPVDFGNLNPNYEDTFDPFSPEKLFTAIGSNVLDVNFFVPGTSTPAATTAFGAVFSDVDLANTTSLQFFGLGGVDLGTFFVPAATGNETFSFLGALFPASDGPITRVRITSGNAGPGPDDQNGNPTDVVMMDDFLYAEPAAVPAPEPAVFSLLAAALGGVFLRRRNR